ncbi:MAG: hypothetical protein CPDRYMAC_4486 [uncultured Paraburkholderia sp.]|nr:MAG: hypothetical protein CPDRYDRY_4350 [uncultured Paraburkholderia sp.]CAH2936904.1 MAG: hypothetical protein CPDRYMAC_4486 [uncultured Paraburkholderia sp.]
MRLHLAAITLLCLQSGFAHAECECRCMSGQNRPICSNAMELPPLCAPSACPLEPPSIQPLAAPQLPPLGTTAVT